MSTDLDPIEQRAAEASRLEAECMDLEDGGVRLRIDEAPALDYRRMWEALRLHIAEARETAFGYPLFVLEGVSRFMDAQEKRR